MKTRGYIFIWFTMCPQAAETFLKTLTYFTPNIKVVFRKQYISRKKKILGEIKFRYILFIKKLN